MNIIPFAKNKKQVIIVVSVAVIGISVVKLIREHSEWLAEFPDRKLALAGIIACSFVLGWMVGRGLER